VAEDCRRLHDEELYNLYASPNIVRKIKSRNKEQAGDTALMADVRKVIQSFSLKTSREEALGGRIDKRKVKIKLSLCFVFN
jgi:hypothetical protein